MSLLLCEEVDLESRSLTPCAFRRGHLQELKGFRLPDRCSMQWELGSSVLPLVIGWACEENRAIWRQDIWTEFQAVCVL